MQGATIVLACCQCHLITYSSLDVKILDNEIDGIPAEFCENGDWMNGQVSLYGCDAILCPPRNAGGRQDANTLNCTICAANGFYGTSDCVTDPPSTSPSVIPSMPPSMIPSTGAAPSSSQPTEQESHFPSSVPLSLLSEEPTSDASFTSRLWTLPFTWLITTMSATTLPLIMLLL